MIMIPHRWRDCRPAILETAWARVPEWDRQLFHVYYCFGLHNAETRAAVARVAVIVRDAMNSAGEA
jgi:hypothetical protein